MKKLIIALAIVLIPTFSWGWDNRYEIEDKLNRIQRHLDLQQQREEHQTREMEWKRRNREFNERWEGRPEWLREYNRDFGYDRPIYPE